MADLFQSLPLRSWRERMETWRRGGWFRPALTAGGGLLAVVVIAAAGMSFLRASATAPRLTLPRAEPGSAPAISSVAAGSVAPGPSPPSTGAPVTVTVHVAGQVAGPGIYAVPTGARVADVVVAAGGTLQEADIEQLNLAARVADGERIYVPRKGEPSPVGPLPAAGASAGGTAPPRGPVDLNAATPEQLDALPGVGPATSRAILAYRLSHGRFRSVTELLEVPGIGPAKLEALRPLVKV